MSFQDGALAASQIGPIIQSLQGTFNQSSNIRLDASQLPNPFLGVAHKTFVSANETLLTLVDGGEDGEVIPIQPLLVKARKVDTIFAIDAVSIIHFHLAMSSTVYRLAKKIMNVVCG